MMKAFEKSTPSLFVLSTPLQVLCAIEAMHEFEVEDYLFIVPYYSSEVRAKQTFNMLGYYNIKYSCFDLEKKGNLQLLSSMFQTSQRRFERVFIGHYADIKFKMVAYPYLKKGGNAVYLDDGISSIAILRDNLSFVPKKDRVCHKLIDFYARMNGINFEDYFFTIYTGIETKKKIFVNSFKTLFSLGGMSEDHLANVFFIGTNPTMYCKHMHMNMATYENMLRSIFDEIKSMYSDQPIYYIPHGRDNSDLTYTLCEEYGFVCQRINEAVESYIIKKGKYPKVCLGLTSSALFNIKKMLNKTLVVNYFVDYKANPNRERLLQTSEYYSKNGIEMRMVAVEIE